MQHALMREFDWFDWTGELLALGLLALVVAHVLPAWTLLVAVLFILRPMARVTVRIAAGLLGA